MGTSARFGKYRFIATLGRGGMADVYLALQSGPVGFRKLVVVKKLRADVAEEDTYRAMLLDEARLAARLRHPNVVQTLEVGVHEGQHFMAMEYLEGQPLGRLATAATKSGAPVSAPVAVQIIMDVLSGLHYAHELHDFDGTPLGIVHRDISPQNVFVTYDGEVKLVDFGIARTNLSNTATQAGTFKGKPSYTAPEQVRGDPIDRRADVFATGIVLWELLAHRRLFRADTPMEAMHKLLLEEIPLLSSVNPDVHPILDAVCARALQKDPDSRFETAAEMRAALQSYFEYAGMHPIPRDRVGEWVAQLFEKERAAVRDRITECMRVQDGDAPRNIDSVPTLVLGPSASNVTPHSTSHPIYSTVRAEAKRDREAAERRRLGLVLGGITLALAAAATGVVVAHGLRPNPEKAAAAQIASQRDAADNEERVLRLCGSNTIGAELAPALVEAYFKKKGFAQTSRAPGKKPQSVDIRAARGDEHPQVISVEAEGSATAFTGLANGTCDVGMASRAIHDDEVVLLAQKGLGEMRSPANEHVIALDGIAVVVHPNNTVRALDADQLRRIFTGTAHDWSELGAAAGPISVFARDDASGTYDTFKHFILGKDKLVGSAKRFADSDALSDAVANEPGGIGFIGLAYIRSATALAVSDRGAPPMFPSPFTVTTEGYMLSRRLYFYTAARPSSPLTRELVTFALSPDGQNTARAAGFVDLSVRMHEPDACEKRCSARYAYTIKRARRLSLDFRFRSGTKELDSRGTRDLDRVVAFLNGQPGARVLLLGFSDGVGNPAQNLQLSRERAKAVGEELAARGVHAAQIDGFGAEMAVASNADETGRERNRRVEVWIAPE
ncbi:protein kinase [Pendulispora brunnea]|uniref:Protein kinase n=1 Tax=Pendulispora brunnea TaxID=2905690 RepID=A0ABZ2KS40_9BACT